MKKLVLAAGVAVAANPEIVVGVVLVSGALAGAWYIGKRHEAKKARNTVLDLTVDPKDASKASDPDSIPVG